LSRKKKNLDMLSEAEMLGCKLVDAPMDPNSKLMIQRYMRLVGNLNYFLVTQPEIICSML